MPLNHSYLIITICWLFLACSNAKKVGPVYSETPVTTPQSFAPGIISTDEYDEFDICFTPDGKTAYFTRRIPGEKQKIYKTAFTESGWTTPEVASFSTDRDETPYITPDGQTFYFGSQREIPGKPNLGGFDMNVWTMKRTGDTWSDPKPLPEPINFVQEEGENWPSSNNNFLFTLDGETHYFTTMMRGAKAIDVHTTKWQDGQFTKPVLIEGLFENDNLWKYSASLSRDGKFLVFNSYDVPGSFGGEDLYVSKRTSEGWSQAANMGALVNSPGQESSGRFSPDGRYFFFTHADNLGDEEYSSWSIYFIETEYLGLEQLFE